MRHVPIKPIAVVALLALAAHRGIATAAPLQNALAPAGPQAALIHDLWNLTLAICTLVFAAVLAALIVALWRRPRADAATPADVGAPQRPERGARRSVGAAVAASVLLLVFLIVASVLTDRALAQLSLKDAVRIELTSNQWWWEARYDDSEPARVFTTANELHIPVGRPVLVTLKSNDVIHSLWVPNLAGKKDLIPGRTATLQLQADRAGTYRGQCAEFCGFQHAFMALDVVARPNAEYEAWAEAQRASAPAPADPQAQRGRAVFLSTSCVMCHSIQGTSANAHRAPDLTHVGSRSRLAAGTLPNTPEAMHQWIRNPQRFKPGSNMPATTLPDEDVQAIVSYLRGLQ
jgi:cytochrome c oxidase subunit II